MEQGDGRVFSKDDGVITVPPEGVIVHVQSGCQDKCA